MLKYLARRARFGAKNGEPGVGSSDEGAFLGPVFPGIPSMGMYPAVDVLRLPFLGWLRQCPVSAGAARYSPLSAQRASSTAPSRETVCWTGGEFASLRTHSRASTWPGRVIVSTRRFVPSHVSATPPSATGPTTGVCQATSRCLALTSTSSASRAARSAASRSTGSAPSRSQSASSAVYSSISRRTSFTLESDCAMTGLLITKMVTRAAGTVNGERSPGRAAGQEKAHCPIATSMPMRPGGRARTEIHRAGKIPAHPESDGQQRPGTVPTRRRVTSLSFFGRM
jgi:hypothetical protein